MSSLREIAVLGEFDPSFIPHSATNAAIDHSCAVLNSDVEAKWVSTQDIEDSLFDRYSAIWVAPGSPYKNLDKTLWAIREARERNIPCLGTCGGFQHIVLEYARNVLGFQDARHAEYDPYASNLFISQLACSLAGREMQLHLTAESRVAAIYGALRVTEQYYCNFGVNPEVVETLKSGPIRFTGCDNEGEI
jgi:CTP synthase (UTP-ammonia lyase)